MMRLKVEVVYAQYGYVASVTNSKGECWCRVYSRNVRQSTVISDYKNKLERKYFKLQ